MWRRRKNKKEKKIMAIDNIQMDTLIRRKMSCVILSKAKITIKQI